MHHEAPKDSKFMKSYFECIKLLKLKLNNYAEDGKSIHCVCIRRWGWRIIPGDIWNNQKKNLICLRSSNTQFLVRNLLSVGKHNGTKPSSIPMEGVYNRLFLRYWRERDIKTWMSNMTLANHRCNCEKGYYDIEQVVWVCPLLQHECDMLIVCPSSAGAATPKNGPSKRHFALPRSASPFCLYDS